MVKQDTEHSTTVMVALVQSMNLRGALRNAEGHMWGLGGEKCSRGKNLWIIHCTCALNIGIA